jgi:hypothetical protein
MSLNTDNLRIKEFTSNTITLIEKCEGKKNTLAKIQPSINLFDYLVKTQTFWKHEYETRKMDLSTKNKLLEFKETAINFPNAHLFPADKYLKLLGYYCSYETKNGLLCTKHLDKTPCKNICKFHRTYDKKLKLTITTNLCLLKDVQNIVIEYIR